MREILFRGKTDKGEWVKGDLLHPDNYGNGYAIEDFTKEKNNCFDVIPDTIGQYTGLTANGTKIFEGDIVKCTDTQYDYEFIAVVLFGNPNGEYNWGFQLMRVSGAGANTDILLWVEMEETGALIEVIGNIHDNPELLKGGADNG